MAPATVNQTLAQTSVTERTCSCGSKYGLNEGRSTSLNFLIDLRRSTSLFGISAAIHFVNLFSHLHIEFIFYTSVYRPTTCVLSPSITPSLLYALGSKLSAEFPLATLLMGAGCCSKCHYFCRAGSSYGGQRACWDLAKHSFVFIEIICVVDVKCLIGEVVVLYLGGSLCPTVFY